MWWSRKRRNIVGRIGLWELIIILAVFILLFGAKKLPEIANSLGKAIREFKKISNDNDDSSAAARIEKKPDGNEEKPS
jgi:sec-independent protein translocase protein TatA